LGTVFFGVMAGHTRPIDASALEGARATALLTIVLIAAAFALGYLLPRAARTPAG
jgi:hypothetical protein